MINPSTDPILQGLKFRSIGPAVMMGRLDDIEGADRDPMTMYLGFATGGVWKSTDAGNHWLSLFDEMPFTSIGDIAIAPSDPNVVYVGTGEPNNRQSSSIGGGVWGTRDGGKTWTSLGLEETQSIGRIAVDPLNPNIVFVAAVGHLFGPNEDRGLYKSSDGGKTWKKAKYVDADTGFNDVQVDPSNGKIVYASSYQRRRTWWGVNGGGPGSGMWKSIDGGETWNKITGGGFPTPKDGILGRIGISIFRARPATLYIIAEVGAEGGISVNVADDGGPLKNGPNGQPVACCGDGASRLLPPLTDGQPFRGNPERSGVWRSDDAGKTWTFESNTNNRPIYYSQIRVDPVNDRKLIQGGAGAQMSFDAGKTWNPIGGTGHGDYHAIWINPKDPRVVAVGHDGGLDISTDGGFTWDYHNDMALGQFYQVSADMRRPYVVCGGLQDNQAWCGPSAVRAAFGAVNTDWATIAGGDGFYTRQDPSDSTIQYGESQNASMTRYELRAGTQKSIQPRATVAARDGGAGATGAGAAGGAGTAGGGAGAGGGGGGGGGRGGAMGNVVNEPTKVDEFRFYWNSPFEISPHDPATIYMAGQYFFKSNNRGDTWTMNPKDLTKNVDRFSMPIMGVPGNAPMASKHDGYEENSVATQVRESPSRPGVIWVGTDDGNLQVSQDGGATFVNVAGNITGGPKGYVQISRVEPSHFDPATAYVALDNHRNDDWKPYLFKTTDYGRTWTTVTANLPVKGNINALREDLVNPNLLFVGTEFGLFVTLDAGKTWKTFMTGLPSVRVDDILIHPRDRDLIIATHGRSLWIADDITPLEQLAAQGVNAPLASGPGMSVKLFEPRPAIQWKSDLEATRRVTGRQFRGENPQGGTAFSFWAQSDMGDAKFEVLNAQGQLVSTVGLATKAGMNRVQWNMTQGTFGLNAPAPGGGRGGGPGGGGGGRGGAPASLTAAEIAAGQAAYDQAAAAAAVVGGAGGQTSAARGGGGGRGGAGTGVPFVAGAGRGGGGGFGGGGGGLLPPGTYMVRLTVGDQTLTTSVVVLEDVWMRK
jgi:photosystem II stability/assembly factor-like uncharacterized protein